MEEKEKENNKISSSKNFILLLEKLLKEFLIINRIFYKTKNQFRKQKVLKLINELKKKLLDYGLKDFRITYLNKKNNGNKN
jgi:hypothetical protein